MTPEERRPPDPNPLVRRLGTADAVVLGMGSMIGAGIFAAFAPAAQAAGAGLLVGLGVAAAVAYCNAMSSAALAARYPESGGTYVYGRRRLGPVWGYLAGWGFVIGKTASCAAMALTFATYAAPGYERPAAVAAAGCLVAVNYVGVTRTAGLARVLLALTLLALGGVVAGALGSGRAEAGNLVDPGLGSGYGTLQAAGLLFFAFAGYARIATLGEEIRDPGRTIPRAIPLALGIVVALYALVAVAVLLVLGPRGLAASVAPLAEAATAGGVEWLGPVARVGAAVAGLGALLAMIAGVGRTTLAMAREHDLPAVLAGVHPRYRVPHRAELALGVVVVALVLTVDLRGAIGFSSFAVLVYYAIANAAAVTLPADERRFGRWLPVAGLLGCVVLAASLPPATVLAGLALFAVGLLVRIVRTHRPRALR